MPQASTKPTLPLRRKLLFALFPTLAILLLAETAVRIHRGVLFANYREMRLTMSRRGYPAMLHPTLGYIAKPGAHGRDNLWGTTVTIDQHGFRSNGQAQPEGENVLVVGDSFTFGDEVDDDETWPAALERELARPVHNAGVFGYGFDQSILRAEYEFEKLAPTLLVVSLIADDLNRAELSRRYTGKPFFRLAGDTDLTLCNVPVPPRDPNVDPFWKDLIGLSALADAIVSKSAWRGWYFTNDKSVRALDPGTGVEVGKRLVARIASRCAAANCRLILVMQGEHHHGWSETVVEHARNLGVETLDLIRRLELEEQTDPSIRDRLFDGHMTAVGNEWVARHIAALFS